MTVVWLDLRQGNIYNRELGVDMIIQVKYSRKGSWEETAKTPKRRIKRI